MDNTMLKNDIEKSISKLNGYYKFPSWLLKLNITSESKILYMYLYNLLEICNLEYLYITANDIENSLGISTFKRRKILSELTKTNLIKRENRGKNTKTYIYSNDGRRINKHE